jgi:serine/threonine protein kinase
MAREADVAKRLNHRAVTVYVGLFIEKGSPLSEFYIVSDYVNGGEARAYLAVNRTPEVAEKLVRCVFMSQINLAD